MLPKRLLDSAQNAAHTIYCPHGHALSWKETETDKLRRERDRLKQREAMLEDEARMARERADKAEATTKRLKKRAAAGTCPCCQRTFSNMSRHMQTKHPQFKAEAANVVPLKSQIGR
jgi:uncharacterized protein (DUF3084 family)